MNRDPEKLPRIQGQGTWNAYVERGSALKGRRRRLAEVPDPWREQVRRHVACYFRLKAQAHRDRPALSGPLARAPLAHPVTVAATPGQGTDAWRRRGRGAG